MRPNPSRYPYCFLNTTELCPIRDPPFIVSPCSADCLHDCPVLPSISTCITCLIRNRVREAPARRREKVLGKKRDNSPTYPTNICPTATQLTDIPTSSQQLPSLHLRAPFLAILEAAPKLRVRQHEARQVRHSLAHIASLLAHAERNSSKASERA